MGDILDVLDFNSGPESRCDDITQAIYRMAAAEIRKARRDRDHYRRKAALEAVASRAIKIEADALERALSVACKYEEYP